VRILFLTHSFNSLSQRLFLELTSRGHEVSIEYDINNAVTTEAVALYGPDLIIAPYLKRAIPEDIWRNYVCLVIHPGVKGDRGPSALDWAIMNGEQEWGITVLQANGEMDAGDIWASVYFPMRSASKSSLYRNEVTEASTRALLQAVDRIERSGFTPEPLNYKRNGVTGKPRPLMTQAVRSIDWVCDDTATVMKKIQAADSFPGVLDSLFGKPCYLFNAFEENILTGVPGEIIAQRNGAICRATIDGAVWITHLKEKVSDEKTFKLPASLVLGDMLKSVPESSAPLYLPGTRKTYSEIRYEERNRVGYLYFEFYNGAMSTDQCNRLRDAYLYARNRDTRVIALMGGSEFWSNGIHLNMIEAAGSPADESWCNINAMNELTKAIITTDTHLTISALQGNAGAGGAFLALAADRVYARSGVILNPHYKGMGNLYGSEYWSYLLPRRVGETIAKALTENRLPIGAQTAKQLDFIDDHFADDPEGFRQQIVRIAEELADSCDYFKELVRKRRQRQEDERGKPLEAYRVEEMERMKHNFYGFDPSYHVARYNFVYKVPHSWTPLHLALHRSKHWPQEHVRVITPALTGSARRKARYVTQ
jgi:putative two-component system hydrogenase maturation factor HypX/HoxX